MGNTNRKDPTLWCVGFAVLSSMFCLATTGTGVGDSRYVVCESCGCAGGECDDLGRSWDINSKIDRRNSMKQRTMSILICI